jgi:hypothetical protein
MRPNQIDQSEICNQKKFSHGRNARYRWGVPGRCHSYFTIETRSDHGFVQRAPATTRAVSGAIGVYEAV